MENKFISVLERLPEQGMQNKVLCFIPNQYTTSCIAVGFLHDKNTFNLLYDTGDESGYYPCDFVTHWMPLPEMPDNLFTKKNS